jgi:hypothetical protein
MPAIITLIALVAAAFLGYLATAGSQTMLVIFVLGLLVSIFAFFSPKASLVLLVFSMLLSPKIGFGAVGGGREAVLRYDDILLVVIFFSWLARTAILKGKAFITSSPVQGPVLIYTSVYILSTSLGIMRGNIQAETSVFYLLKFVEYFLLYFMTVNIVETKEDIKQYMGYGIVVALAVTAYAYYYYHVSGGDRATAPFEATMGSALTSSEPASLGGYYLVIFSVLLGLLTEYSGRVFFLALAALAVMLPAFLLTFSRASYIGFGFMALALLMLTRKRKALMAFLFCAGLLSVFISPVISGKVLGRITMTYKGDYANTTVNVGGLGQIKMEESAADRVQSLNRVLFEKLPKHMFLGWGVTGIGIGDTQYALLLGEVGTIGFFVFFWMIYRVFSTARTVYRAYEEPWIKAMTLGLMIAVIGLLFQSLGVNSFIIVRIMEPFWFLTALVTVLYRGSGQEVKTEPEGLV